MQPALSNDRFRGVNCGDCIDTSHASGKAEGDGRSTDFAYILFLIIIGLALRLDFILPVNSVIDADEAIVGLMARHIVEGRSIPIFYYGQHYMGSLEAILTAGMFRLFGESSFVLKLTPLFFSLVLIPLMYLLTRQYAGRIAARFASFLTAIPPVGLIIWSGKARGGFIEILVIGVLALLFAGHFLLEVRRGYFNRGMLLAASFCLGLGWWVNNQIIFFFLPVGLILLSGLRESGSLNRRRLAPLTFSLFLAFILGGLPFWLYNLQNGFVSFRMFQTANGGSIIEHAVGLFSVSLPILIGSKRFWEGDDIFQYSTILFLAGYLAVAIIAIVLTRRFKEIPDSPQHLSPYYLLVFIANTITIFIVSSFGHLTQAPRYLLPIYVGIFVLTAIGLERIHQRMAIFGLMLLGALGVQNLTSAYFGGRALPGEPMVYGGDRVAQDHTSLISFLRSKNISVVRTNYWIGYRLAFETAEQIRFIVFQHPKNVRIPEYETLVDPKYRDFVPLVLSPHQADIVNHGLHALGYDFERASVGGYEVFYNLVDRTATLSPMKSELFSIHANYNDLAAGWAVDGDLRTRWGSAHPKSPDMFLELRFPKPQIIGALRIDNSGFETDIARSLQISGFDENNQEYPLSSVADYEYARYTDEWSSVIRLAFPEKRLSRLIIRQKGSEKIYDWSIAELSILSR
jgi:hypothetical protein